MKKLLRFLGRLLALILALLLCAGLVMFVVPLTETGDKSPVPGSADWMAQLPDELLLSDIVLPGTHDSATQYVQLAFFSKCQALSIGEQLEAGYRYLDIRLGVNAEKDGFELMHGFTRCKEGPMPWARALSLERVLADCRRFLEAHPSETVLFAVKQERGDESVSAFETLLDEIISRDEACWLLTDTLPTLGEARGRLVLLRRYDDEAGLGRRSGVPLLWTNQNGFADPGLNVSAEENGSYTLYVQDRYEYAAQEKWAAFTAGMEHARADRLPGDAAIHFLSTKGTAAYGHPFRYAKALNEQLMRANSALDGWIAVDFASAPLAERIYASNAVG